MKNLWGWDLLDLSPAPGVLFIPCIRQKTGSVLGMGYSCALFCSVVSWYEGTCSSSAHKKEGSWESHTWLFLLPGAVQMEENVQSKVDAPTGNFSFSSLQVGCVDATRSHSPYFGKCLFPSLFLFALLGVTCVSWCVLTHVNKGDVLYPINTCVISHSCNEGTSKSIASVECSSQYPFSNSVTTCLTQHLN